MFSINKAKLVTFITLGVLIFTTFSLTINSLPPKNDVNIGSTTLDSLKSSIRSLDLNLGGVSTSEYRNNVILKYSSDLDKNQIIKLVLSLDGQIRHVLTNLQFIVASLPAGTESSLKSLNQKSYSDSLQKVVSDRDEILIPIKRQKINQNNYVAPIHLISGDDLISENFKGKDVRIAILDTGVDASHPDLTNNVKFSESFVSEDNGYEFNEDESDGHGHGTHVAGIAAGNGAASGSNYIGVAPEASIYNLKVASQNGWATVTGTLLAIEEAIIKNVDIISISLGFEASNPEHPLSIALDEAVNTHGIHVTVSAGNSGPGKSTISTPAASRSVITVGASYLDNKSATFFSSRGPNSDFRYDPDIIAPGYQVISPLASTSITALAELYYSPSVVIPGSGGNYISFSGTSMAAPAVAGSLALLLSKYPGVTPMALRSAIMSSADDNGEEEYVQGSGYINLETADDFLSVSTINQISILPQRNIFPDNPQLKPNEELNVRLQILSGSDTPVQFSTPNSTLANFLSLDTSSQSLNSSPAGFYGEFPLKFKVPLNPEPGRYEGIITVNTGIRNYNLSVGPIDVTLPKNQIAWNIWYTDDEDSIENNYLNLNEFLIENNIRISLVNKPISSDWIFEYSTIVLPDLEYSISNDKIQLLGLFVELGGNLVIISSFYPFSNVDNLNKLSTQYGQEFSRIFDMEKQDLGLSTFVDFIEGETINLVDNPNLKFNISGPIEWNGGNYINVYNSASVIANLNDSTSVIAGFFGNSTHKGKVITLGSEYFFYNDFYEETNKEFSLQLFSILNEDTNLISIVKGNSSVKIGEIWSASIYLENNEGPVLDSFNATLTFPNSTIVQLSSQFINESLGSQINYKTETLGVHVLNIEYNSIIKSTNFLVTSEAIAYNLTIDTDQISINRPVFLDDIDITVIDVGSDVKLSIQSNTSDFLTGIVTFTQVPERFNQFTNIIQDLDTIYSIEKPLVFNSTSNAYEVVLETTTDFTTGFYYTELEFDESLPFSLMGDLISEFYLGAEDPKTDLELSTVNGKTLSFYEFPEDETQPEIMSLRPGTQLTFSIKEESTPNSKNEVFLLFIPFYPFIDSGAVINYWQLEKIDGLYSGTVQLPHNTSIIDENDRILSFANNNLISAVLIVLIDQFGNYDLSLIVSLMTSSLFDSLNLDEGLVFIVLVVIPASIILVYYIRGRNRKVNIDFEQYNRTTGPPPQYGNQNTFYPPPPIQEREKPVEMNFCPYCGTKMTSGENFCMECGRKL